MKLYHGSNVIVQEPKVLTNGHYKDFGYGFYCTNIENNICSFSEMSEEWLDFVVDCRRGTEQ